MQAEKTNKNKINKKGGEEGEEATRKIEKAVSTPSKVQPERNGLIFCSFSAPQSMGNQDLRIGVKKVFSFMEMARQAEDVAETLMDSLYDECRANRQ